MKDPAPIPYPDIAGFPRRIVCLTEETTEVLYLLGEDDRIAGVSGFTARPPQARLKPKISAFTSARFDRILELRPDLVIGFSNLQADIARELISRGVNMLVFNQRSITEILQMVLTLARMVGAEAKGAGLVESLQTELELIAVSARRFPRRPKVFFEEWKDPLISGIRWVEELVEIAGGEPVFPELRQQHDASKRIVDPGTVAQCDPEVVIASWCGMKVNKLIIRARAGWEAVSAVRNGHIYEVKSTYILQPGPAALTEGVRQLHAILAHVVGVEVPTNLRPAERVDADLAREEKAQ
ncbi:cobalamin-binding protein [uncultured Paludibaculum sp.]|uniref:cobalamin-binding protein n=1 Tax=uncultured Paludibaculum sp. TaxID=1765020 RepID=UPI002AAA9AF1|nr:cobalamin-binding protein [uncultured Paludibaculum sp.]